MYAVQSQADFYHGKLTTQQAYGALLGLNNRDLRDRIGCYLVRDSSKREQWILSYVSDEVEIRDAVLDVDEEGDFQLEREDTGHDEMLMLMQALSSPAGVQQMQMEHWNQVLSRPVAPFASKKDYKEAERNYKGLEKELRQAAKLERKLSRKNSRNSRRSRRSASTPTPDSAPNDLAMTEAHVVGGTDTQESTRAVATEVHDGNEQLRALRSSLKRTSVSDERPVTYYENEEPKEEWVVGALAGKLRGSNGHHGDTDDMDDGQHDDRLATLREDHHNEVSSNPLFRKMQGYEEPDRPVYLPRTGLIEEDEYDVGGAKTAGVSREQRRLMDAPKATPNYADSVVREYGRHQYGMDGVTMQALTNTPKIAPVNEQARGPSDQVGRRTLMDAQATDIQRAKRAHEARFGGHELRPPQDLVGGAMSRDKQADASWAGAALQPGQVHDVPDAPGTLSWEQKDEVRAGIIGHVDDQSPFFHEHLLTKEDAEALLHLVGNDGTFLLRPHPSQGNTKYMLSVRYFGKVTHHLVFRVQPGAVFSVCCLPYAVTNEEMREGRNACTTLTEVLQHLMTPRPYWPGPLGAGVPTPTTQEELQDMMDSIQEYYDAKARHRAQQANGSKAVSRAKAPQPAQLSFAKGRPAGASSTAPTKRASSTEPQKPKQKAAKTTTGVAAAAAAATTRTPSGPPSYNHGMLKKSAAEALILPDGAPPVNGRFLFREKQAGNLDSLVITVVFKDAATHHMCIRQGDASPYIINKKLDTGCSSIDDVIAFLRTKRKYWPLELTEGVAIASSESVAPPTTGGVRTETVVERTVIPSFYHGKLGKKAAEQMLLADSGSASQGKFLFRSKADDTETEFIISVIFKGKPTHHNMVRKSPADAFVVNGKLNTEAQSLEDAIQFLRTKRKGWPLELSDGIVNDERSQVVETKREITVEVPTEAVEAPVEPVQTQSDDMVVSPEPMVEDVAPPSPKAKAKKEKSGKKGKKKGKKEEDVVKIVRYSVTVLTGDGDDHGTCASAAVKLHGMEGVSEVLPLRTKRKHTGRMFEPGQEDEFTFELADVGPVTQVSLQHDNTGPMEDLDWFVDKIIVDRFDGSALGDARHMRTQFSAGVWISASNGLEQSFDADSNNHLKELKEKWKHTQSAELARLGEASRRAANVHVVSVERNGVSYGKPTQFDNDALEMRRQVDAGDLAHGAKRDRGIARGAAVSGAPKHDFHSLNVQREVNAPKVNRIRPQGTGAFYRDKAADAKHTDENESSDATIENAKMFADRGTAIFT